MLAFNQIGNFSVFFLFSAICEQLTKFGVVSPLLVLDEMSSLRSQYRLSVHRMLIAAIHKSKKVGALLFLLLFLYPSHLGLYHGLISSPELLGSQGELIVYPCSGVRPSSVHNFKHLLL